MPKRLFGREPPINPPRAPVRDRRREPARAIERPAKRGELAVAEQAEGQRQHYLQDENHFPSRSSGQAGSAWPTRLRRMTRANRPRR